MSDVDPNAQGNEDSKEGYVKVEDMAKMVNQAITSHLKRLDFDSKISAALENAIAPLRDSFQSKQETKQAPKGQDMDPQVVELKKQLEAMQKQTKEAQDRAAAQLKASREKDAFGQLKSMLSGKVKAEAVDSVAKILFHADKRIKVSDEGEMLWLDGDNEIGIEDGLKSYLKSKEAAIFMPAPATSVKKSAPSVNLAKALSREVSTEKGGNAKDASALLASLGLNL